MKCEHKLKLKSKTKARRIQTRSNQFKKKKSRIYKCPHCGFYHLTTIKKWYDKKRNQREKSDDSHR